MQDFTKLVEVNTEESQNSKKQPNWVTKDRFWTFVFWFGMSLGLSVAHVFGVQLKMSNISNTIVLISLIGVPVLVNVFNGTKFIKALTFANSEGTVLTEEQRPYLFGYAIFAGFGVAFVVAETVLSSMSKTSSFAAFICLISLFAPISLYFIYKNCPISILFNHKFWTVEGNPNIALLKKVAKIIKDD